MLGLDDLGRIVSLFNGFLNAKGIDISKMAYELNKGGFPTRNS